MKFKTPPSFRRQGRGNDSSNTTMTSSSGVEFLQNIEGILKKFRVTKENDKDREILTLANLDNGYIRKFIVKKVDEKALLASFGNKDPITDENENDSTSLESGSLRGSQKLNKFANAPNIDGKVIKSSKKERERLMNIGKEPTVNIKKGKAKIRSKSKSPSTGRSRSNNKKGRLKKRLSNGSIKSTSSLKKKPEFQISFGSSASASDTEEEIDISISDDKMARDTELNLEEDPGVINPVFMVGDEDDGSREDGDGASGDEGDHGSDLDDNDSSLDGSPLSAADLQDTLRPTPQQSPCSYRSGYQSHRSSVSSTRKGILKKSGSSSTINMEMANMNGKDASNGGCNAKAEEGYGQGDIHRFVGSSDYSPSCDLNKSSSFASHRVKFILDPGKPDNIQGSYDDIPIEEIERKRVERIERGNKLQVTNSSRLSQAARKCLLLSISLAIISAFIVFGVHYERRKVQEIDSQAHGYSNIEPVPNLIEVKFKISNKNYDPIFGDQSSKQFIEFASDLEEKLKMILVTDEINYNGHSDILLKIIKFEPNITTTFRVWWQFFNQKLESPTPPLNISLVKHRLTTNVKQHNGSIGLYQVNLASLSVHNVLDKCITNITGCSHECQFSTTSLRFTCTCPDHLILVGNKECTDVPPPTQNSPQLHPGIEKGIEKGGSLINVHYEHIEPKKEPDIEPDNISTKGTEYQTINGTNVSNTTVTDPSQNGTNILTNYYDTNNGTTSSSSGNVSNKKELTDKQRETLDKLYKSLAEKAMGHLPDTNEVPESPLESSNSSQPVDDNTVKNGTDIQINGDNDLENTDGNEVGLETDVDEDSTYAPYDVTDIDGLYDDVTESSDYVDDITTPSPENESDLIEEESELPIDESDVVVEESEIPDQNLNIPVQESEIPSKESDVPNQDTKLPEEEEKLTEIENNIDINSNQTLKINPESTEFNETNPIALNTTVIEEVEGLNNTDKQPQETPSQKPPQEIQPQKPPQEEILPPNIQPEILIPDNHTVVDIVVENTNKSDENVGKIDENAGKGDEIAGETDEVAEKNDKNADKTDENSDIEPQVVQANQTTNKDYEESKKDSDKTVQVVTERPKDEVFIVKSFESDVDNFKMPPVRSTPSTTTTTTETVTPKPDNNTVLFETPINGTTISVSQETSTSQPSQDKIPPTENPATVSTQSSTTTTTTAKITITTTTEIPKTPTRDPNRKPCLETEFECVNGTGTRGHCISKYSRCDGFSDCSDFSDEDKCEGEQCFGNFQCFNAACLDRRLVCDGINHCSNEKDKSRDEIGCNVWKCREDEFKCQGPTSSECIPISQKCDGQPDCFNHTDEQGCSTECPNTHFFCPEGYCIPNSRKCDGKTDCLNGEDETQCDCTGLDETSCGVGGCIPTFHLCDGLRQCPDGSDEWECLRLYNQTKSDGAARLEVRSGQSRWSSVCGVSWTPEWSNKVCEQMGYSKATETNIKSITELVPKPKVGLNDITKAERANDIPMQYLLAPHECPTGDLVHISCEEQKCGEWTIDSVSGTSDGATKVLPPLTVLLHNEGSQLPSSKDSFSCTSTILSPTWVITAYSCLQSKPDGLNPDSWTLMTEDQAVSTRQTGVLKSITVYPGVKRSSGIWEDDIALVRLDNPLVFDKQTQPVCLSDSEKETKTLCIVAGWNSRKNKSGLRSFAHYLNNPFLPNEKCNSSEFYSGKVKDSHACVHFTSTKVQTKCYGHEGNPLMCQDSTNHWSLEGILTRQGGCGAARLPSIFTTTHHLNQWIRKNIGKVIETGDEITSTTSTTTVSSTTPQVSVETSESSVVKSPDSEAFSSASSPVNSNVEQKSQVSESLEKKAKLIETNVDVKSLEINNLANNEDPKSQVNQENSDVELIAQLPGDTKIFEGNESSKSNALFSLLSGQSNVKLSSKTNSSELVNDKINKNSPSDNSLPKQISLVQENPEKITVQVPKKSPDKTTIPPLGKVITEENSINLNLNRNISKNNDNKINKDEEIHQKGDQNPAETPSFIKEEDLPFLSEGDQTNPQLPTTVESITRIEIAEENDDISHISNQT